MSVLQIFNYSFLGILISHSIYSGQFHLNFTPGDVVKAAKSALSVEETRLQKFTEIDEQNQKIRRNTNKVFSMLFPFFFFFLSFLVIMVCPASGNTSID